MKLLVCFLFFLTTSVGLAAQEPPETLARHGLKGPVRTVETGRIEYVFRHGESVEGRRRTSSKGTFNADGNRTEFVRYGEDGAVSSRQVYQYDALGRYTGYEGYYTLGKGPLQGPQKGLFTLDEHGRTVEYIVYDPGGALSSRFTYRYDPRGNKLEHNMYGWTGQSMGRLVYTYDEAGHQLTETSYDRDDAVAWKSVNSYDSKGHLTEWVQYQKGVQRYKKIFDHDDEGRVIKQETLEFNKPRNLISSHAPIPGTILYTYRKGSRETASYDSDGNLKGKEINALDDKGNVISWEHFNADGSTRYDRAFLQIDYDSHGNWIKKTHLRLTSGAKEPRAWSAEFRIISYY